MELVKPLDRSSRFSRTARQTLNGQISNSQVLLVEVILQLLVIKLQTEEFTSAEFQIKSVTTS